MPLELPRIFPNFVDDKKGLSYGSVAFVSDSGLSTRITSVSKGHGFSMLVRYEGITPSEVGDLLTFFNQIRYDYDAGESALPFLIPSDHPFWRRVLERDYIEPLLLQASIDLSLWQAVRAADVKTPILNVNSLSFGVKNVWQ